MSWTLHDADPELAAHASEDFERLGAWFEAHLAESGDDTTPERWTGKLAYQDRLTESEIERLESVLVGTTFLKEAVQLAFDGARFELGRRLRRGHLGVAGLLPPHPPHVPGERQHRSRRPLRPAAGAAAGRGRRERAPVDPLDDRAPQPDPRGPGRAPLRLCPLGPGGVLHGLGERPQRLGAHPRVRGPARGRVPPRPPRVAQPLRAGAVRLLHRVAPQRPAHRSRDGGPHQRGGSRARTTAPT